MRVILFCVAAIVFGIGTQGVHPNASPSGASKSGSTIGKENSAKEIDKAKPKNPEDTPTARCVYCFNVEQPAGKTKEEQAKADSLDTLYRAYMWATMAGVAGAFIGLFLIWRQSRTAEKAANAASLNAQAVINSERPWIFIPTKGEFSEIGQPFLFPKLPGEFRISYCDVWIKNFGRTPANIIEQKIRLVVGKELQEVPEPAIYESKDATPENYMFPPDERMIVQAAFDPDGFIGADDLVQVTSKDKKTRYIWLCGYFKYLDTFGRIDSPIYETRICYRWVYDAQSQIDSDIHRNFWIMAGPREYNKAT